MMKKRISAAIAALCLCLVSSVGVFALPEVTGGVALKTGVDDGRAVFQGGPGTDVSSNFTISPGGAVDSTRVRSVDGTQVLQGETYYFRIAGDSTGSNGSSVPPSDFETSSFRLNTEYREGKSYVQKVEVATIYDNIDGRVPCIAIRLKKGVTHNDTRIYMNVYFQALKDGSIWTSGDVFNVEFDLAVDDGKLTGSNNDIEVNTNVTYQPDSNADNTVYWSDDGYDIAALEFRTGSNPGSFNALLSTKINNAVYTKYGDPVNAVLYFRTFSRNAVVSSSRATLLLMNPFDWDVAVNDVRIYTMSGDTLTDVTQQFNYDRNDDLWYISTRSLGSYVLASKDLMTGAGAGTGIDTGTGGIVLTPGTGAGTSSTAVTPGTGTTPNASGATVEIVPLPFAGGNISTVPSTGDKTFVTLAVTLGLISLAAIPVARAASKRQKRNADADADEDEDKL